MPGLPTITLDKCPLCERDVPLVESHIIPRFVTSWLKETSATGYLRHGTAPNVRAQDGFKQPLLCLDCEQLIAPWEKATKEKLFVPYHDDRTAVLPFGDWFSRFCVSVSFRVLVLYRGIGLKDFPEHHRIAAERALQQWREFLLGTNPTPGQYEQHLLPVDVLAGTSAPSLPTNMSRYMARAVQADVVRNNKYCFVFTKMCGFVLVGFVTMDRSQWPTTRVPLREGTLRPRSHTVPGAFGEYLTVQAQRMASLMASMSPRQKERVNTAVMNDMDRFVSSDTMRALDADVSMFGGDAFPKD